MSTLYYEVLRECERTQTVELRSNNNKYDLIVEQERDHQHPDGYKYEQILVSLKKEQLLDLKRALNELDL